MKSFTITFLILFSLINTIKSQNNLPYHEIPKEPLNYTAGKVAARMIDGLGFRYYWATEGLREKDLAFKPSKEARTTLETLDHILELSAIIINSVLKQPHVKIKKKAMDFDQKRKLTLENLKKASDILKASKDISAFKIIFKRGKNTQEYPFWNMLNGPIADALWHCGQVVSFRRSSGNPFNSKVSVFTGTIKKTSKKE